MKEVSSFYRTMERAEFSMSFEVRNFNFMNYQCNDPGQITADGDLAGRRSCARANGPIRRQQAIKTP